MTLERVLEIFKEDSGWNFPRNNAMIGLQLISKYLPLEEASIRGADHDIIYSVFPEKLLVAGLTEEDAMKLRELNWMIEDESGALACYV